MSSTLGISPADDLRLAEAIAVSDCVREDCKREMLDLSVSWREERDESSPWRRGRVDCNAAFCDWRGRMAEWF